MTMQANDVPYPYFPFRRDWGSATEGVIVDLAIALDALTPSVDDYTMRILRPDGEHYTLTITRYATIDFEDQIGSPLTYRISREVTSTLFARKYLLGLGIGVRTDRGIEHTELFVVSDDGERAWRDMILN
jgi:hypothetical protein